MRKSRTAYVTTTNCCKKCSTHTFHKNSGHKSMQRNHEPGVNSRNERQRDSSNGYYLFNHCASRNAMSLVYWLPTWIGQLRWIGQFVDWRCSVAGKLKETGQILLTAHTHMHAYAYASTLCDTHTHTHHCGWLWVEHWACSRSQLVVVVKSVTPNAQQQQQEHANRLCWTCNTNMNDS